MITFHVEQLITVWDDFEKLTKRYWIESEADSGDVFQLDKTRYIDYNNSHYYILYIARNQEKQVCGYGGMYILPSMYTKKLTAVDDAIYLLPRYRKGWNAVRFFKFIEKFL